MKIDLFARAAMLAAPVLLFAAAPAAAQEFPADPVGFWEVTGIELTDGGGYAYMQWLASEWKREQEFAKSKGWISGYKVLSNNHPRDGEPDLYLIVMYDDFPNSAEQLKQRAEYMEWQTKSVAKMEEESMGRLQMRRVMGTSMLTEMKLN